MQLVAMNDETLLIKVGDSIDEKTHVHVKGMMEKISEIEGVISVMPGYTDLSVSYDVEIISFAGLVERVEELDAVEAESGERHVVQIPVCYGMGLDLERVASLNNVSVEAVIRIHSSTEYLVHMMGFVPGFPYLGGLDERLHTPRLEVPRTKIPAGSVGIGGKQTGIYPLESPGGWNIIGRTPLELFDKEDTLIHMGDYVRFVPISEEEFERWKA